MKLTIGFSPCPNDTFIFDALIHQKNEPDGLSFEPVLADVETLNEWALEGKLDITKLSLPAFFKSTNHYALLNAGSALGKGVGPLLISNKEIHVEQFIESHSTVALPGFNTTANLLFDFAFPAIKTKTYLRYNEIEDFVLHGPTRNPGSHAADEANFGVIIHENRFTYRDKGLFKIMDLGEHWEKLMQVPIPLGSIAIRKSIPHEIARTVDALIQQSLQSAWQQYPDLSDFVKENAQEMEEAVMRKHIQLYVNHYSIDLGIEGKRAIAVLYKAFQKNNPSVRSMESSELFANG